MRLFVVIQLRKRLGRDNRILAFIQDGCHDRRIISVADPSKTDFRFDCATTEEDLLDSVSQSSSLTYFNYVIPK